MKPLVLEWVRKAEADFTSAEREFRARKKPNYELSCFLSQQCLEKYLKALLQERGIRFGRTHDLGVLLDLIAPADPGLEILRSGLDDLTRYAVAIRYPGESVGKRDARDALSLCRTTRTRLRSILGLRG